MKHHEVAESQRTGSRTRCDFAALDPYCLALRIRAFDRVDQRVANHCVLEVGLEGLILAQARGEADVRLGDVQGRSGWHVATYEREATGCVQRLERLFAARASNSAGTKIQRATRN